MKRRGIVSFQTIKTDILQRIKQRDWPPGTMVPGEETLAQDYGCSRNTVNRALRELAQAGVIERRRRAGTRVAVPPPLAARIHIPVIREEIEQKGATYRYALLEREELIAPAMMRGKMALPENAEVIHVRCLHYADETPYQFEDRWINLAEAPDAREQAFETVGPNEWLVETKPLAYAEHIFSAANATPQLADWLEIEPNDALFVVERRTWSEKNTITAGKLFHPGFAFRLVSRATSNSGEDL